MFLPHALTPVGPLAHVLTPQGKKVLELGCGHGVPGILALLAGAEVHFQDFNQEVLRQLTMPNVMANLHRLPKASSRPSCRFFAGDWSSVGELLTNQGLGGHYDLILTAESIYNPNSQSQLLECIKQVLQPPLGLVMVAAKSYYFGVGGGVQSFIKAIQYDNLFDVSHAHKTSEDVTHMVTAVDVLPKKPATPREPKASNGLYREVLELTFPISIQPYFL
ncbi:hypothetical protein DUNSADRAFT_12168 [Dunaliella salina]|uniref:protein-histidine N-methyltransferase n=1 Tax=Dunaliella salina TaxID=3046 RepID=A0ABQ7GBW2_DUNSA|nr:hypothetical protein DUNSADRAFT_12168 [Dunaliella salina]|eukprot:KAF5832094.1 hypothetical protein DUNSADRAFT_12168 [Dunaliella salina]